MYDFVHVHGKICNERLVMDCTCSTFTTINQATLQSPFLPENTIGSCCHTRFFKDVLPSIESELEPHTSLSPFININKVKDGIASSTEKVLKLNSKSNIERYSVSTGYDAQFVTIMKVHNTTRKIVQCHSSLCKLSEGNCRSVNYLHSSKVLCQHLTIFRNFYTERLQEQEEQGEIDETDDQDHLEELHEATTDKQFLPDSQVSIILKNFNLYRCRII